MRNIDYYNKRICSLVSMDKSKSSSFNIEIKDGQEEDDNSGFGGIGSDGGGSNRLAHLQKQTCCSCSLTRRKAPNTTLTVLNSSVTRPKLSLSSTTVSYTHLTLPTNREV
eukprot:TRINITY_DN4149_c0_g1_i2.p1 TRINITY_DN4149_c0_g1~~TRINITY_DN4149_c0_g1_i2.p1  ORF type:complete len:110 (-),score=3.76 TRINITY_DN4149_c0_g1_i2:58-387(-)